MTYQQFNPYWYTLTEAARAARCSRRALLVAIRRGDLGAKLSGCRWLVRPHELAAWRRHRRLSSGPGRAA